MIELLYSIDVMIFFFFNHTIANPVFDVVLPFLTDLNKQKPIVGLVLLYVIYLLIKGDKKTRSTIGLLVLTIFLADQISSSMIKPLFARIRPCSALEGVRLLVECGPGFSFPSSHAVNNFAGAMLITRFYPKQKIFWFSIASLIAISRPYVGVHYPSDILAGGILGCCIAWILYRLWLFVDKFFTKYFLDKAS